MSRPEQERITIVDPQEREWALPLWRFAKWHNTEAMLNAIAEVHPSARLQLTPHLPGIDGIYFRQSDHNYDYGLAIAAFMVNENFAEWADWEEFLNEAFPERNSP